MDVTWLSENWEKILLVYLAVIKLLTTIRDVIDKTPGEDTNWFERTVTVLNKTTGALLMGKRP